MDPADDGRPRPVDAVRAVGADLRDCETVAAVAGTAVEGIEDRLDPAGVALCRDGESVAVAGSTPADPPPVPRDRPAAATVADGPTDRAAVAPVGDWGVLWLWRAESPDPAVAAALGDRIGAAFERVRAERGRGRATDRIETVAAVVNHDLSNPLTIAEGYLDVARRTDDPEHLGAVADALGRIGDVSEAVVTVARRGERVRDPPAVPLRRIAHEAWRSVEGGRLAADEATLSADPDRLLEILERLFDNSVRYGDDPTVTVRTTDDAVVVADDGPGVAPDRRERAIEPGYSTADGRPGLGLTVVDWLADAHGWSLSLRESECGGLAVVLADADVSEPSA